MFHDVRIVSNCSGLILIILQASLNATTARLPRVAPLYNKPGPSSSSQAPILSSKPALPSTKPALPHANAASEPGNRDEVKNKGKERSTSPAESTESESEPESESTNSDELWDAVDDPALDARYWEEANDLAARGDEREYVVQVGRETGVMSRWYVTRQTTAGTVTDRHHTGPALEALLKGFQVVMFAV